MSAKLMPKELKEPSQTTLYLLIEAGQLARQALLQPLAKYDLAAGDDAVLLALSARHVLSDSELSAITGLPPARLLSHQKRLIRLDLITRSDPKITGDAGSKLTEKGKMVRRAIVQHWTNIEEALLGDLKSKRKKHLLQDLTRFADLLSL